MAYIAPIHRATSVRHAIKISFLAPDSDDLIIAKSNRLEIWTPHPQQSDQLAFQCAKTLYGKVTMLEKFRPATSQTDHLFVGTDRYHFFAVSWDAEKKQLKTEKAYHDIADRASRDSQTGDRVHIDPTTRFMTVECYEGVVNVLPIAHAGKGKRRATENEVGELGSPVPVRIPELFVRDSCFLHTRSAEAKTPNPRLALLHEDSQNKMRLKIRELEFEPSLKPQDEPATAELEKSKDSRDQMELGASHLIPLPAPMYGAVVIGETSISYVEEFEYAVQSSTPLDEATVFVAWCAVDDQRYALADDYGKLYLLFVEQNNKGEYAGHRLDLLGETSRASTLVYLDDGRIFVGSHQGDSQIFQMSERGIDFIQKFDNIAPILDFTVMDMGNRSADAPVNEFSSGQARLVSGSGAFKDGSLRSIRSGVGLEIIGSIGEMGAPVSALFSMKSSQDAEFADTLVVSFVSQTRIFAFSPDGEAEEIEAYRGFNLEESTLFAGDLADGKAVQVTSRSVIVADPSGGAATDTWNPPMRAAITDVAAEQDKILVSCGGGGLVVLDVSGSRIQMQAHKDFDNSGQVSCIALSNSLPGACVVGFWQDSKVAVLDLQALEPIATTKVAEDESLAVPRSLMVANMLPDQPATLFVGLADGNVITYGIKSADDPFTARKSIILGTQQANFALLPRGDGLENVFATCEHPSLIYGQEGRIVYSAVTVENATSICAFDSAAFGGAIVIATEDDELKLAVVDEERRTHVQNLPVGETVRRIAYSPEFKAFGLGTIKRTLKAGAEEVESHFKLVDEIAFQELHTFALDPDELIESVIRCKLNDGMGGVSERFIVGTAFLSDEDQSTARGRILVFEVTESRQLTLVTELSLKGACRCLGVSQGRIVAALIKTVVIYSLEYRSRSRPSLFKKAAYRTATAPIDLWCSDTIIAVTDLMKSVSLLQYDIGRGGYEDTIVEKARHFETLWGTAVANVDDNTYLASDAEGNLIVLQHQVDGFSEEDRRRLTVTSEMLLGEMVNRIRRIDVQPTPNAIVIPRAFVATVEGSIYLFALIADDKKDLLMRLQSKMAEYVISPGHVPFNTWRGFRTAVRDMGAEGPTRFVDGELIERFLDAESEVQEKMVDGLGIGVEEVKTMVESLKRVH